MSGEGQKRRQFTYEELRMFDGREQTTPIYVALNGNVFDVTDKGKQFYGPGGPYAAFAGRDASRCLATMTMETPDGHDDLSDLTPAQRESLERWEMQFKGKYALVGEMRKP